MSSYKLDSVSLLVRYVNRIRKYLQNTDFAIYTLQSCQQLSEDSDNSNLINDELDQNTETEDQKTETEGQTDEDSGHKGGGMVLPDIPPSLSPLIEKSKCTPLWSLMNSSFNQALFYVQNNTLMPNIEFL